MTTIKAIIVDDEANNRENLRLALASYCKEIIFVTAYNQHAIRAIKFCAIDYLLKPIDVLELKQAVNRVLSNQEKKQQQQKLELLSSQLGTPKKIALPQSDHVEFIALSEIIRCQGEKNYTWFYLQDGRKLLVSQTLKEYVGLLEDAHFFRVHQSHLINLQQIKKYSRRDGGYVVMTDKEIVPVARNRKDALQVALKGVVRK